MKKISLEDLKNELKAFIVSYFDECVAKYEDGHDASLMLHWFETTYMKKHMADMALDHVTFRIFLRKIITKFYTKKEVDKKLNDQKWFLIDFINESILTVLPYKDKDGNKIDANLMIEDVVGRVLYDAQLDRLYQYRENEDGKIISYVLSGKELRDYQIVFMENMPSLEESIYFMKDGKLESILATEEHAGLMSSEYKQKIDSYDERITNVENELPTFVKEVSLSDAANVLPKTDGVVTIPIATDSELGVVKAGENVTISQDGSINVDIPVSIDEVVNLRSITTEPDTANEGDCYYNSAETLIHYYTNGAWDSGSEPQKSKVYFFEDGATIHQYRSDGDILIEIQDTPQIATQDSVGLVKGGENVVIGTDGSINVPFDSIQTQIDNINNTIEQLPETPEQKEYDVATETNLGLVRASNVSNNSAETFASDGNVQVSGTGKMRVRKLIDLTEVGNHKYRFAVNPDETIENLRDSIWENKESYIVPIKPFEDGYSLVNRFHESGDDDIAIFASLKAGENFTATITNSSKTITVTRQYTKLITGDLKPIDGSKYDIYEATYKFTPYVVIKDAKGNNLFNEKNSTDNILIIDVVTEDMLPLYLNISYSTESTSRRTGKTTNKPIAHNIQNPYGFLDIDIMGASFNGVEITEVEEVSTPIKGNNIVFGKNGLLIQSESSELYAKVLEDGTIEHTFGATQNTGQANVIEQVRANDIPLPITNKSVNIKIALNGELIEPNAEGVIDIIASGGGTATVPDAVEDNVVTFATEGQLKDSGKKIGGEEFGEYEQIPVREVIGLGSYNSEKDKVYGYYIDKTIDIVYKEKECLTAIGQTKYSAHAALYYFNTEGDVNSGLSSTPVSGVAISSTAVHYLNGERIIDANTIATEKGVENFLTPFNLVAPKYKTGDVVYSTNVPDFHFGVMSWEEYVKNPTNSMDTKMPIGLVVDPVKRTFLFCMLLGKYFATSDNIETYFVGYTSFEDGAETFERVGGTVSIPVFYALRNQNWGGTIFYVKNNVSYVPSLKEWKKAKEHLCTAFYTDENDSSSPYAGFMDRLLALRDGVTPSNSLFIGKHNNGTSKLFYSQISTVGKVMFSDGTLRNVAFNMNGERPYWDNAIDEYACCPVFGIYTEAEEHA